jgi:hypothetical protein
MKLNINAKELLALYNVLYERFEVDSPMKEFMEEDPRGQTHEQLRQLYNRVKACLVASLTNRMIDPLDSWLEGQRRKIDQLNDQNEGVKQEAKDLVEKATDQPQRPVVLSAEDTEVLPDSYPRRRPPPPVIPQGKFRGTRR